MYNHIKTSIIFSLAISLLFYLFSNFFVFVGTQLYEKSLVGFLKCYWMAIPFFINRLTYGAFIGGLIVSLCTDKKLVAMIKKYLTV